MSHPEILQLCHSYIEMNALVSEIADATSAACERIRDARDPGLVALVPPKSVTRTGWSWCARIRPRSPRCARVTYSVASRRRPHGRRSHDVGDHAAALIAPGVLARLLEAFSENDVNLTSLTSRPLRTADDRPHHAFVVTADGHVTDTNLRDAVRSMLGSGCQLRLLGAFPRWTSPDVCTPFGELPLGSVGIADAGTVLDPPRAPATVRR